MKKIKSLIKMFSVVIAILLTIAVFPSANVLSTYAANETFDYEVKVLQDKDNQIADRFLLSEAKTGDDVYSKTYKMYDETGTVNALRFWSYYNTRKESVVPTANYSSAVNNSTGEIKHQAGSASSVSNADGHFYMVTNLSDNIAIAGQNGYVSIEVSAQLKSGTDGKNDVLDKVFAGLDLGLASSLDYAAFQSLKSVSETTNISGNAPSSYQTVKFNVSDFSSGSKSMLFHVYSEYSNAYNSFGWKVTSNNMIFVNQPTITVSTTDKTAAIITSTISKAGWSNENKLLSVNLSDTESGIHKVYVYVDGTLVNSVDESGNVLNPSDIEFSDNTRTAKFTQVIEKNSDVKIVVVDNVGNVSEKTYTETKIDKFAPSVDVSIQDGAVFTNKTLPFNVLVTKNSELKYDASVDTFSATYTATKLYGKELSQPIEGTFAYTNGANSFVFPENGEYTFVFTAIDEAGNEIIGGDIIVYVSVDDRTIISLQITQNYTYNPSGFTPDYQASPEGEYDIEFTYFTTDGSSVSSINKIGTYTAKYVIDEYLFKGNGEQTVVISPKVIEISNFASNTCIYSGEAQTPSFDATESKDLIDITYIQNDTAVSFVDAGEYVCKLTSNNINYVVAEPYSEGVALVMNKQTLSLSNVVSNFVYSAVSNAVTFDVSNPAQKENFVVYYFDANKTSIAVSDIVDAGTYYAVFEFVGNSNNFAFDTYLSIDAALEVVVQKREISVNAVAQNIVYGDELQELSYSLENVLEIEPLAFTLSTNYQPFAGEYDITIDQKYSLTDDERELFKNYQITYNEAVIKVSPKAIVVTPNAKQSKVYGDADKVIEFAVSGLVSGDELSGALARQEGEDIGYYNITIGTLSNPNYKITLSSERFEIVKRMAFIFAASIEKVYGAEDPNFAFNKETSNIIASDLAQIDASLLFVREEGENVGAYAVELVENAANIYPFFANYNILSLGSKLNIKKAIIRAEADNIATEYGNEVELSYTFISKNIDDEVVLNLERTPGTNVGEYEIYCLQTEFDNYSVVFENATYRIVPRQIVINAFDSQKVYGNEDDIDFEIQNAIEELEITILRAPGENVGKYAINSFAFTNPNYRVVEFKTANLTIVPAEVVVEIENGTKIYGEMEPKLSFAVSGLKFNDKLEISVSREAGEDAGTYKISANVQQNANYVVAEIVEGVFTIEKADLEYVLEDASVIYSGSPLSMPTNLDLSLDFVYADTVGEPVEAPVNAGEYVVYATFAGNNNYNPFKTNTATLVVEKKFIPITLKKQKFVYNGKAQAPEYDINLETPVSVIVEYVGTDSPVEVGSYDFRIVSNDANHFCAFSSTLYIVDEFFAEDTNGGASVSTSNVNFSNSGIQIQKNESSKYMSKFSPLFDGRKCLAVYEFVGGTALKDGEVFTVRIKAPEKNENISIFSLDEDGKMTAVAYSYVDGYYVLSVNNLSADILLTRSNNMMQYAKIVALATVFVLTVFVTKIINRHRRNSFFAKNTKIHKFDKEFAKANAGIVYSRVNYDKKVSVKSIIGKK